MQSSGSRRIHWSSVRPWPPLMSGDVVLDEDVREELVVPPRCGVTGRLERHPARPEPRGRPLLDLRRRCWVQRGKLGLRILREQRVDPVPTSSPEPEHEEVRLLELGELCRRVGSAEHGVAELGRELPENRGTVEERAASLVQGLENLGAQVFGHESVVPAERPHRRRRVGDGAEPDTCQDERSRPTFGPLDERAEFLPPELHLPARDEQLVRLLGREGELARAQLCERAAGTQLCEPQRWIDPGDGDHADVGRQVREGVVDRGETLVVRHCMQVVEHDHELTPERRHAVQELVDGILERAARYVEPLQRTPPESGPHAVHGRRQIPPQPNGIVVPGVEVDPGQGRVAACAPAPYRGRLAIPGRGRNEGQDCLVAGVQRLADPRSIDGAAP